MTNETMIDPLTQAYETKVCGRCGGTGQYSYCQMYGTRCFGCSGKGKVYTRRGLAAIEYARKLRTVKAEDVQPGWLLWEGGGPFSRAGWFKVIEVGLGIDGSKWMNKETGEWMPYYIIRTTESSIGTFPGSDVQAVVDKSRIAAFKALSLGYQATLTKTGTVRKTKKGE